MEAQILALLAEGALAPEQIAANHGANDDDVRHELEALRERGLVERSEIVQYAETGTALAYWRITDAGRARLEQLRAESD